MEKTIEERLKEKGWNYITTGGGCDAYLLEDKENPDKCLLMTALLDGNIPYKKHQQVVVGFYTDSWGSRAEFSIFCTLNDILNGKIVLWTY